jgi:hypothetical protein
MTPRSSYDVFVCYRSVDQAAATELAKALSEEQIAPGHLSLDALQDGLSKSEAAVVLVGTDGIGRWQEAEVQAAFRAYVQRGLVVVPVMLEGASAGDGTDFLSSINHIDCKKLHPINAIVQKVLWAVTGERRVAGRSPLGEDVSMQLGGPATAQRTIQVFRVPPDRREQLVEIDWDSFGRGVERLVEQVKNFGSKLDIDACIGINDAGLVVATFLASAALRGARLVNIRSSRRGPDGAGVLDRSSTLPKLRSRPAILLCDFELKTGSMLKAVWEKLVSTYDQPKAYLAVFGALVREPRSLAKPTFEALVGSEAIRETCGGEYMFVSAVFARPGIEPPLGLR